MRAYVWNAADPRMVLTAAAATATTSAAHCTAVLPPPELNQSTRLGVQTYLIPIHLSSVPSHPIPVLLP